MYAPKILIAAALAAATFATTVAARSIDQKAPLAADGRVRVSNVAGSIKIRGGSASEVHVTGDVDERVKDVQVTAKGGDVEVKVVLEREGRGSGGEANLVIEVPAGARPDVETVSASVDVDGVNGKVALQTVSGDVTLRGSPESAEVQTVSGRIDVDAATSRLETETVSGATKVRSVSESVEAKTTSGSIDIEAPNVEKAECTSVSGGIRFAGAAKKDADLSFENFSGSITLELPSNLDADVAVKTFSGDIRSDVGGSVERPKFGPGASLEESFGDGSARITVNTFSGSVKLAKLRK